MVKITLFTLALTLLLPAGAYALVGFKPESQKERKNIIEKIKSIDPDQIKNDERLGYELNTLVKQLKAERQNEIEQLKEEGSDSPSALPKLSAQETAVLLKFTKPEYNLGDHAAIRGIMLYLKDSIDTSHDESLNEKASEIVETKNNTRSLSPSNDFKKGN